MLSLTQSSPIFNQDNVNERVRAHWCNEGSNTWQTQLCYGPCQITNFVRFKFLCPQTQGLCCNTCIIADVSCT